jgi:uncharacterized protein YndB with AHSA1/START domain
MAAGKTETDSTSTAERELVITRVFDAPRRLVFEAWTKPEHLSCWCGPRGFTIPFGEMDFRPGGAYRTCLRSPEGKDHWLQGVYREIVKPERLIFTHRWEDKDGKPKHETIVTVTFEEHDGKTKLTFHQAVFESVEGRDSHRSGWSESLDRLDEYLVKAIKEETK